LPKDDDVYDAVEDDYEIDTGSKKKGKGKGVELGGLFLVFIFILGFVIGSYLTIEYIQPFIAQSQGNDPATLQQIVDAQDKQIDRLVNCLDNKSIDPETCLYKG